MDDLDRRLVAELRINGRASLPQLAQILGVARVTVQKRLDRMIDGGQIKGFTIQLKDDLPDDQIRAFVLVEFSGMPIKQTIANIRRIPGISAVFNTNGVWDMIAELKVGKMVELNDVIAQVRAMPGVNKSETFILLGPA